MKKCFTPNGQKLKCPLPVVLPKGTLAPNTANLSSAMRQSMQIKIQTYQ
jgi:hypothetical protein